MQAVRVGVRKDADPVVTQVRHVGGARFDGLVVTNKALTSNVATLTSAGHPLIVGQWIVVSGVDATFNGSHKVTAVTAKRKGSSAGMPVGPEYERNTLADEVVQSENSADTESSTAMLRIKVVCRNGDDRKRSGVKTVGAPASAISMRTTVLPRPRVLEGVKMRKRHVPLCRISKTSAATRSPSSPSAARREDVARGCACGRQEGVVGYDSREHLRRAQAAPDATRLGVPLGLRSLVQPLWEEAVLGGAAAPKGPATARLGGARGGDEGSVALQASDAERECGQAQARGQQQRRYAAHPGWVDKVWRRR